jgi:predicted peroxiredoxin
VRLFVNLAAGPENPTRAALAFLVARTAAEEGHEVRLFLAGDAVQLVRPETAEAARGIGTGSVAEHWEALTEAGVPVALSGMSSKTRGINGESRPGVELAQPTKLVELADWAEKTLVY